MCTSRTRLLGWLLPRSTIPVGSTTAINSHVTMQPLRALCMIALAVLFVNGVSAGRLLPSSIEDYAVRTMSSSGKGASTATAPMEPARTLTSMLDGLEEHFGGPVHIMAHFYAPPSLHREFVEEWGRFADAVRHSHAKVAVHLTKPMGDNIKFVAYMYAADGMEFRKLFKCEGLRDFMRFLGDRNIPVMHQRLIKLGAAGPHAAPAAAGTSVALVTHQADVSEDLDVIMASPAAAGDTSWGEEGEQSLSDLGCGQEAAGDQSVATQAPGDVVSDDSGATLDAVSRQAPPRVIRMATRFEVPPGAGKKFVHAWKKLACKAGSWKGTRRLALFSTAGDNTRYLGYAAWEAPRHRPSKKEQEEKVKVFRKWKEEVEELGVAFHTEPVIPIRPSPNH